MGAYVHVCGPAVSVRSANFKLHQCQWRANQSYLPYGSVCNKGASLVHLVITDMHVHVPSLIPRPFLLLLLKGPGYEASMLLTCLSSILHWRQWTPRPSLALRQLACLWQWGHQVGRIVELDDDLSEVPMNLRTWLYSAREALLLFMIITSYTS